MATNVSIGYGPSRAPQFAGESEQYEMWELRFKAFLRLHKLHKVVETTDPVTEDENAEVYANLVQALNDKSLNSQKISPRSTQKLHHFNSIVAYHSDHLSRFYLDL